MKKILLDCAHAIAIPTICIGVAGALLLGWLCLWVTDERPAVVAERARQAGL